jgi:hypothetical protein
MSFGYHRVSFVGRQRPSGLGGSGSRPGGAPPHRRLPLLPIQVSSANPAEPSPAVPADGGGWPAWRFLHAIGSKLQRGAGGGAPGSPAPLPPHPLSTQQQQQSPHKPQQQNHHHHGSESSHNGSSHHTMLADACPLECMPGTPTEVIRALAPERIASAAGAVRSALRRTPAGAGSVSADAALTDGLLLAGGAPKPSPAKDLHRALTRLRGGLSETAYEAFCNEVEAAALRVALQYPAYEGMTSLASLASLGGSYFEDEEDDEAAAAVATAAAAAAVAEQERWRPVGGPAPQLQAVADGGGFQQMRQEQQQVPTTADGPTGPADLLQQSQLPSTASWALVGTDTPSQLQQPQQPLSPSEQQQVLAPAEQPQPQQQHPQPQQPQSAALHSGQPSTPITQAGSYRPTVVGAHPITVLPAFGSPDGIGINDLRSSFVGGRESAASPSSNGHRGARRPGSKRPTSPASPAPRAATPHFSRVVFGGGGARTLAYAGAMHALRTLGIVRRLDSVAGASGGAILAVLAALGLSPAEILGAMGSLPDQEQLSWMRLATNRNLGLASGAELFGAIEQAVAQRTGVAEPTLGDVERVSGVRVFIATTSLAKRAPLYLNSRMHAGGWR